MATYQPEGGQTTGHRMSNDIIQGVDSQLHDASSLELSVSSVPYDTDAASTFDSQYWLSPEHSSLEFCELENHGDGDGDGAGMHEETSYDFDVVENLHLDTAYENTPADLTTTKCFGQSPTDQVSELCDPRPRSSDCDDQPVPVGEIFDHPRFGRISGSRRRGDVKVIGSGSLATSSTTTSHTATSHTTTSPTSTSPSDHSASHQSSNKKQDRERNRIAAHKCRKKAKINVAKLQEQERGLSSKNKILAGHAGCLQEEILGLKNEILRHAACDSDVIHNYIAKAAREV